MQNFNKEEHSIKISCVDQMDSILLFINVLHSRYASFLLSHCSFPDGTEVTFNCIATIMGEKTTWKIICEDGSWVGRSLNCGMFPILFQCEVIV
jgi:hypothetical protein